MDLSRWPATLHLVSADSLQGSFDHVVLPAGLTVHTLAGDVVVQATPICAGDIQASGGVDMDDLTQLLAQWGACSGTSGDCSGDLNGDGTVDVADLLMILSAWGPCE